MNIINNVDHRDWWERNIKGKFRCEKCKEYHNKKDNIFVHFQDCFKDRFVCRDCMLKMAVDMDMNADEYAKLSRIRMLDKMKGDKK